MTRVAFLALLAIACGGSPRAGASASHRPAAELAVELRQEIAADWMVLRELRAYQPDAGRRSRTVTVCQTRAAICAITATVCNRATRAGDAWSFDKCHTARAACRDAEQACCRCRPWTPSPSDRRVWCGNAR